MLCRHLLQLSEITETVEAVAASRGQLHPAPAPPPPPPGQQRLQQCSLRSARESARVSRATITTSPVLTKFKQQVRPILELRNGERT